MRLGGIFNKPRAQLRRLNKGRTKKIKRKGATPVGVCVGAAERERGNRATLIEAGDARVCVTSERSRALTQRKINERGSLKRERACYRSSDRSVSEATLSVGGAESGRKEKKAK